MSIVDQSLRRPDSSAIVISFLLLSAACVTSTPVNDCHVSSKVVADATRQSEEIISTYLNAVETRMALQMFQH